MNKKNGIIGLIIALLFGGGYAVSELGGVDSFDCDVSTISTVDIGSGASVTLVASSSNRAWARIQQVAGATTTLHLSFDGGAAATVGNGLILGNYLASSSVEFIDFGLNTNFPYIGAVTGITVAGGSTVLITECKY